MAEELKACPEGHLTVTVAQWPVLESRWKYFGFCTCCGFKGMGRTTEAEAIAAWNTRTGAPS